MINNTFNIRFFCLFSSSNMHTYCKKWFEGHHWTISQFILGLSSACVCVSMYVCAEFCACIVCTCVNIFLPCRLSASCHSWTTHGHICQCHEVEPFPARAGNLFHFPRVFWPLYFLFSMESLWKCAIPKNAITFFFFSKRLLPMCRWRRTDMNVFVYYRNWSWIASCSTLTDQICAGSRTCDTPWPTALRLLSVRFPREKGIVVVQENRKNRNAFWVN